MEREGEHATQSGAEEESKAEKKVTALAGGLQRPPSRRRHSFTMQSSGDASFLTTSPRARSRTPTIVVTHSKLTRSKSAPSRRKPKGMDADYHDEMQLVPPDSFKRLMLSGEDAFMQRPGTRKREELVNQRVLYDITEENTSASGSSESQTPRQGGTSGSDDKTPHDPLASTSVSLSLASSGSLTPRDPQVSTPDEMTPRESFDSRSESLTPRDQLAYTPDDLTPRESAASTLEDQTPREHSSSASEYMTPREPLDE